MGNGCESELGDVPTSTTIHEDIWLGRHQRTSRYSFAWNGKLSSQSSHGDITCMNVVDALNCVLNFC